MHEAHEAREHRSWRPWWVEAHYPTFDGPDLGVVITVIIVIGGVIDDLD